MSTRQPLADELALAEKRRQLEHERDQLRSKLAQIEDKIRAFDLILHDRQFLAFVRSPSPTSLGPTASTSDNGTTTPPTGLRAAIKAVIAGHGQPMKPIEVTRLLYQQHFDPSHDIGWLKLRVSQEMHRMGKTGKLKHLPSGRYKLPEGDTAGERED